MIYNTTDNEMSHSFLVYKDNDKYYWLENAWLKYRGIHEYDTKEDLLKDVVRKFVSTIKDSDEKKVRLYQFVKPKVGINYDKYVKNAMSGIKISLFKGN